MQLNNFSRGFRYRRSAAPFKATHCFDFGPSHRAEVLHYARQAKRYIPTGNSPLERQVSMEARRAYVLGRMLRSHGLKGVSHPIGQEYGW